MQNSDETTIKIRSFSNMEPSAPQSNLTEEQNNALELVKKTAQLEEEKKKSLDQMKIIEQLQEILKQEQLKAGEMAKKVASQEAKIKELSELEAKAREVPELKAKLNELTEALGKISAIASIAKANIPPP